MAAPNLWSGRQTFIPHGQNFGGIRQTAALLPSTKTPFLCSVVSLMYSGDIMDRQQAGLLCVYYATEKKILRQKYVCVEGRAGFSLPASIADHEWHIPVSAFYPLKKKRKRKRMVSSGRWGRGVGGGTF